MCIVGMASYASLPLLSISLDFPTEMALSFSFFLVVWRMYGLGNCSELCTYVYGSTHSIISWAVLTHRLLLSIAV